MTKNTNENFVTFHNTKMYVGNRVPHSIIGYEDETGMPVRFKNIPVYDEEGKDLWITTTDGGKTRAIYNKNADFTKPTIRLHVNAHKDVIKHLIAHPACISSHHPERKAGLFRLHEPEFYQKKEEENTVTFFKLVVLMNKLMENEDRTEFNLLCAHLGINNPTHNARTIEIKNLIQNEDRTRYLVEAINEGTGFLKKAHRNSALVKLAQNNDVIKLNGSEWFIDGSDTILGGNIDRIHTEYAKELPKIVAEMQRRGIIGSPKKSTVSVNQES